jgi:fucose permease
MAKSFIRDRETWLTYFLMAFYGYLLNILGPLTPFLRNELDISYTTAGFHFSAFAIGMLIAGFWGERLQRFLGYQKAIWYAAFGLAIGTVVLIFGRTVAITLFATVMMGCLGSFILVLTPSMLSLKYKEKSAIALTELTMVASLASMAAPFLVGILARFWFGWRAALVIPILGLIVLVIIYYQRTIVTTSENNDQSGSKSIKVHQSRLPAKYWLFWTVIFLVVAVEFCFIYWGSDYLIQKTGITAESAALSLTLFIGAMLIGRWIGSLVLRKHSPALLLRISIPLTALGFFFYWIAPTPAVAFAGLFISGLGVANSYPAALTLAISNVPERFSAQASSRATLAAGTAILTLPLLLGRVADQIGMQPAFMLVPVLLTFAFVMHLVSTTAGKRDKIIHQEI